MNFTLKKDLLNAKEKSDLMFIYKLNDSLLLRFRQAFEIYTRVEAYIMNTTDTLFQ